MSDFTNRTIIVTGGAQGIGRGIVQYLLQRNARVVIADYDREAGEELLEYLEYNERLVFLETDVRNEVSVSDCIHQTIETFGSLNGLVNNAGIANPGHTPICDLTIEAWESMLRTNLTGAFLLVKHAAPYLKTKRGAIVNISSTRALQSEANTEAYSASKGGLVAFSHALAVSFSNSIRVNCILPGWIDVSAYKKVNTCCDPQFSEDDHLQHPAGRVGIPDDIAAFAAYLLSDEAGFITGQSFVVDGGMTRKMIYA